MPSRIAITTVTRTTAATDRVLGHLSSATGYFSVADEGLNMSNEPTDLSRACADHDCFASTSRRRFLRDSFLAAAGAMIAVGMSSTAAMAMPLEVARAKQASGSTR